MGDHHAHEHAEGYQPPRVEDVPLEDGPAVTAAGVPQGTEAQIGAEWRPDDAPGEQSKGEPHER